ncbi:MAG: DUF6148 family protein [Salinimicrobium sediminis]|nr:DUF6148 family protein [Salinimicrobium sediminis]
MAGTISEKLIQVKERLALYLTAESEILRNGQSYSIGDRSLTRADLEEVKQEIKKLQGECDRLENGSQGMTVNYGLPRST